MTVIREKQNYNYPKPNSTAASDTESLHLGSVSASDAESLNDEPLNRNHRVYRIDRPPVLATSQVENLISIKKSSGKKKLRRYENRCSLQTWNEHEEDDGELFAVMESYKSPFARLLEDNNALQYWNDFIEKSEAEQAEILKAFSATCDDLSESTNKVEKHGRISARIRRIIKIKKDLSSDFVKGCEDELIAFFKTTPDEIFIKYTSKSFDRILLHGIAQYHRLKSISVQMENGSQRSVEVHNTNTNWVPAECFLADSLHQLRK